MGRVLRRSKTKEKVSAQYGVADPDPADLDVTQTRSRQYPAAPPITGGTWRDRANIRERSESPIFISTTPDAMSTAEAIEISKKIDQEIAQEEADKGQTEEKAVLGADDTLPTVEELQTPKSAEELYEVLRGITFAFGYLDDILIFSPDNETHLEHLREVFQRLREADLKLKPSKCNFFKKHIQYLGHLVSGEGIEPLPEKLESLKEMPPPTNPREVRQFLGLAGYYRKFVPKYADIARPLTNLTKQDVSYEWTNRCQQTFEFLKEMLLKEPILKYPDPKKPYTLFTDASKYAWACVLTQEYVHEFDGKVRKILHPITYVSGLFRGSQLNWATLTKEAYAIYIAVRKLDHYIQDAEVTVRSDHLPLKTFLHKNTLNTKVNNWAIDITSRCRKIQFEYIKGIKNTLADTMSRLIKITPEISADPEPPGQEFGYDIFSQLEPIETTTYHIEEIKEEIETKKEPIPDDITTIMDLTYSQLEYIQMKDKFIKNIINRLMAKQQPEGKPYYMEGKL